MHPISSFRGNRPTNKHTNPLTNRQDRVQYTVLLSLARSVKMNVDIYGVCRYTSETALAGFIQSECYLAPLPKAFHLIGIYRATNKTVADDTISQIRQ